MTFTYCNANDDAYILDLLSSWFIYQQRRF